VAEVNPNILLVAGLGVAAYLVWRNYKADAPKGGSNGATGGLVGAGLDLAFGAAPVAASDEVSIPEDVYGGGIQLVLIEPPEGGEVSHTPLRNTFPLRLYVDNFTQAPITDVFKVQATSDARYLPTGTSTYETTFGPITVKAFGRRYVQIPVNFAGDFSVGPAGWDVALDAAFGGASASRSFVVR
jgi:hypothetical protein